MEKQDMQDQAQDILTYALDVGEGLLTRGAEVGRVEDTITRILKSRGAERVDVFTITASIVVTCRWSFGTITQTRRVTAASYDMTALTSLNSLSREICAMSLPPEAIAPRLKQIAQGPVYAYPLTVLFYGMTSFVFSLFFGGKLLDAVISGLIGMLIRLMLTGLGRLRVPGLAVTLLCSIVGGFLAHGLMGLGVPCAADKIAIGDIMLLVPGIGMTNAIRDMFTGDTISGLLRFAEALLVALALAWGFALPSLLR